MRRPVFGGSDHERGLRVGVVRRGVARGQVAPRHDAASPRRRIWHEPPAASVIALMDADAAPLGATTKPPQSDVTLPPAFTRPDEYTLLNWMPCTASAFGLKREKVSIEVPPTAMLGGSKARRTVGAASDKTIRRALVPAADTTPSAP